MRKLFVGAVIALSLLICAGCSSQNRKKASGNQNSQSNHTTEVNKHQKNLNPNENIETSITVSNNADSIKKYSSTKELLDDAALVAKVKVLKSESDHVRSYIYTSYQMQIEDILYGKSDLETITVNMPGGILTGDKVASMLSEVTDGKNAGDLSQIKTLTSNGNTDHLLAVGDEAYLFLIPESENSYAAVGEYDGSVLLRNGKVILNKSLMDNQAKLSSGHKNSNQMTEGEFVNTMNQLISKKR